MAHLVEKETLLRANRALLLGLLYTGLALSVLVALYFDFAHWLKAW